MKILATVRLIALLIIVPFSGYGQKKYVGEIEGARNQRDIFFKTGFDSPLDGASKSKFKKLSYYKINSKWKFDAEFDPIENPDTVELQTTTIRTIKFIRVGKIRFKIDEKEYILMGYQNVQKSRLKQYKDQMTILFTDPTNQDETHPEGRYIETYIPKENKVILDFNTAFNPNAAYSSTYSSPIPHKENELQIPIEAGEKRFKN